MKTLRVRALSDGGLRAHQKMLGLALPMILANVTTPLVGLVDTAVLGRMDSPAVLAGASISALIITQIVWICGFLRMSTTGLSAQALGSKDAYQSTKVLWQGIGLACVLAIVLFSIHQPLFALGAHLGDITDSTRQAAHTYFNVRIWGILAALCNLALIGWMIGQQLAKKVLLIQIVGNLLNVCLNLLFVYVFKWSVAGVAAATVIAEYTMLFMALWAVLLHTKMCLPERNWFSKTALLGMLLLNSNMLFRNIALQLCLAFLTLQGARYGVAAAAINAIIMQFFALIALGLDGIAYAVEALVGEAAGEKNKQKLYSWVAKGAFWSSMVAIAYGLVFLFFTQQIGALLTQHQALINNLLEYKWLIVLLPLLGHWCFLFDGVAIGLTRADAMRNTMILSAMLGFFPIWWVFKDLGNPSLWLAMLTFLSARGISLAWIFYRDYCLRDGLTQSV